MGSNIMPAGFLPFKLFSTEVVDNSDGNWNVLVMLTRDCPDRESVN